MHIVPRKLYFYPADLRSLPPGDQLGEVWVRPLGQSAGGCGHCSLDSQGESIDALIFIFIS